MTINRTILLLLTFCLVMISCSVDSSVPREILLDNDSNETPFLVFSINYENQVEYVAIQNNYLYHYYWQYFGIETGDYADVLNNAIEQKMPLTISRQGMDLLLPYAVRYNPKVDSIAQKGTDVLLKHYFDESGYIKIDLEPTEFSYLIKVLFDRQVYTTIAHFAGILALYDFKGIPDDGTSSVPVIPERR